MRKSFYFLLVLASVLVAACAGGESGPTPEEMLTGSWKLKKFDMGGEPAPIQVMASASFNFSADGTYEILLGGLERGTWSLGVNKKILITVEGTSGAEQHIDITKLTPEEVILSNKQGPSPVVMTLMPDK